MSVISGEQGKPGSLMRRTGNSFIMEPDLNPEAGLNVRAK